MTDAVTNRLASEVLSSLGSEVDSKTYQLNVEVLSTLQTITYAQDHLLAVEILSANTGQGARRTLFVST